MKNLPAVYLPKSESNDHPVVSFMENHGISYRDRSGCPASVASQETGISEDELDKQYPIVKWTDGTLLKNCDKEQLIKFLHEKDYELEDS